MEGFNLSLSVYFLWSLLSCNIGFATKQSPVKGSKVFVLVLDGFIHDYEKYTENMPNFAKLASIGVKAERMIPPFPTFTWPCMTTLNTGLYPESHGIINNGFINISNGNVFSYTGDPSDLEGNAKFFKHEPLWLTNQRQGGVSSVYYWPGYYAFPEKPKYHNKEIVAEGANPITGSEAIDETLEHLQSDENLNFMVVYVDAPDGVGHGFGVSSNEYKGFLEGLDHYVLGYLLERLEVHPDINLIVMSDHGLHDVYPPEMSVQYLEDYLEKGTYLAEPTFGPFCNLMGINNHTSEELVNRLQPLTTTGKYKVYRMNDLTIDFPEHLHYKKDKNILPVLVLADPGGLILESRKNLTNGFLKGHHGYDPAHESMSTIFFAKGPAFKKGVTLKPFESVNVVPLLAYLLGVEAKPNNGSLDVFKHILNY